MPNPFIDPKRVTKPHIPTAIAPIKIDVPKGQFLVTSESKANLKRGRPVGSKNKNTRKKRAKTNDGQIKEAMILKGSLEETLDMMEVQGKYQVPNNEDISTNYVISRIKWNQNRIDVDYIFACNVALDILNGNVDNEPMSIEEFTKYKWAPVSCSNFSIFARFALETDILITRLKRVTFSAYQYPIIYKIILLLDINLHAFSQPNILPN